MANTLQYVLSLNDQMSSKLSKIGINSDMALNKFAKLEKQANDTSKVMNTMGNSVGSLKQKLDLLKAEREWIPSQNLTAIKKYNNEINSLEKQITKLEATGGKGFGSKLKDSLNQIPGLGVITNPIVAVGGALFGATKMSIDFDKGMAAINTTAQLSAPKLKQLKKELLGIDPKLVDDWGAIPGAYEKIISQTGDAALSTDILKVSLKGAKAGFTDVETVSGAVSQSLSLIGSKNASAQQVLDTFFAAKRVGAGEFKDFAQYMPGLIAGGDALGIKYKEVAGMFAYMTGKGQSAERSTVLMENAFSAMAKVDVRKNLKSVGVNIFDKAGSMRSMTDIFGDLKNKMTGMSDEQKSSFLAKMGLVDKEARSAFIVMTSDLDKLKTTMNAVKNSTGETNTAFKNSRTDGDRLKELWSNAQRIGLQLGGAISSVLTPALQFLGFVMTPVANSITWLIDGLTEGNPVVYGLVAGIAALTLAMKWNAVVTKAKAIATGVATAATWLWKAALDAIPIFLIITGVVALTAAVYAVSKSFSAGSAAARVDNEVKQRVIEKTAEQRGQLGMLFETLRHAKRGSDEFNDTLRQLEEMQPGIVDKYNLQAGAMENINAAQKEMIANIDVIARAEAYKELSVEKYKEAAKQEAEGPGVWDYMLAGGNAQQAQFLNQIDVKSAERDAQYAIKKQSKIQGSEKYKKAIASQGKDKLDAGTGITPPALDGKTPPALKPTNTGSNRSNGGGGSRSNEAIATGGNKQTTINMTFKNIVENISVAGKDFKEAATSLQEQTTDAIARSLNMAISTAG
jgi:TP901 family phage tail tape measure protein